MIVFGLLTAPSLSWAQPEAPAPAPVPAAGDWLSAEDRAFLAQLPPVRVAIPRDGLPPYETVAADGTVDGIQAEMLSALARSLGIRLVPSIHDDWASALAAARDGRADMVQTIRATPDRQRYLAFTLGTVPIPLALFGAAGNATRVPDEKAHFAIEKDYAAVELIRRRFPQARITEVASTREALQRVQAGEVDLYAGSLLTALTIAERENIRGLEVREVLQLGSGYLHFGVRRDWMPLVAILNRGILGLRSTTPPALGQAIGAAAIPGASWPESLELAAREQQTLERHPVWRIGAVRGLPLLNDIDAEGRHSGIAADYADLVASKLGVGIEVKGFDNVAGMLEALRAGKIDLVPFLSRTAEREREFSFSRPYLSIPYMLVGRSDGPLLWNLESLNDRRVALAREHPLRPMLAQRYPAVEIVDAANGNEAIDLVLQGRADAAIEVKLFANLRINGDTGQRLRSMAAVSEVPAEFHFAASPKAAELLPLVNRALDTVPEVEQTRLMRRWVAVDLTPPFPWRRWLPLIAVATTGLLLLAAASAWWARRLSRAAEARRLVVERLNDIGRAMPAVSFRYVFDDARRLVDAYHSPNTASFFGIEVPAQGTLMPALRQHLEPADAEALEQASREGLRSLLPGSRTVTYKHPDGRTLRIRFDALYSTPAAGQHAWTGVASDVSAEHALRERLEAEAHERHVLLASASHELRAPAHTLSLALQSLPASALEGESGRKLQIARESTLTLKLLLDEVLDAARVTAGAVELRPQRVDLHCFIDQLADEHRPAATAKGLVLETCVATAVPRYVHADPLRLRQVLTNLLSNSLKYTERGEVRLDVDLAEGLRFQVADTGVGISDAQRLRLFEPFVSAQAAPGVPSTGLGLAVCKRLVSLMGGTIALDRRTGGGTVATLCLPLVEPPVSDEPGVPSVRRAHAKSGKLLVCDDDDLSRTLMAEVLRAAGHAVVEANGVAQALQHCQGGSIALLITDLNMPGGGAPELIAALRAEPGPRFPVIVCSGDPPPTSTAGEPLWDAWLAKPVDVQRLYRTLADFGFGAPAGAGRTTERAAPVKPEA